MNNLTRRNFVSLVSVAGLGVLAAPKARSADTPATPATPAAKPTPEIPAISDMFPTQTPELAREMVGVSHGNLARVNELLALHPTLANATWDWGFGDWETSLGAASHVGIPRLRARCWRTGAAVDLFGGDAQASSRSSRRSSRRRRGARHRGAARDHALAHARAGGDAAKPVYEYLAALGGADPVYKSAEF